MNKKEWLDNLFYKIGKQQHDFLVCGLRKDKKGNTQSTKWRKYSEVCFPIDPWEDYKIPWINQRQILPIEIVIDLETTEGIKEKINKLKEWNVEFFLFATQSKGYHIHLFFKQTFKPEEKSAVIKFFGGDLQKDANKTMIALEHTPHWKSGKIKQEVFLE